MVDQQIVLLNYYWVRHSILTLMVWNFSGKYILEVGQCAGLGSPIDHDYSVVPLHDSHLGVQGSNPVRGLVDT